MLNSGESELVMTRDSEVEVCSEEEGFEGAWFRAILEENTMKKARKRIRVRYLTLLSEDRLSCLVETVQQKCIRPVPKEEDYESVVIEEGVVVDAYFKDGWWKGVVVKEMGDEKFVVLFEVPPDVIKFGKMQLRAHLDWNGWKWTVPDKKVLEKSTFSPGTMVEVRSVIDKAEEGWVPGMVVTAVEEYGKKKLLIKGWNISVNCNGEESRPNTVVDVHRVRPIPPPSSVETFKLLETVEAFRNSKWCKGLVSGVLSEESYMISFEGTKEQSWFKHGCVRPLRVWENGVWLDGPKGNPIEESPSRILRKKAVSSSSGAKPMSPTNSVRLTRRSVAATGGLRKKTVDGVMNETRSIAEAVTPVVIATPVLEEEKSKDASRKRKRNEQDLSESDGTSNGSKAKTNVEDEPVATREPSLAQGSRNEMADNTNESVTLDIVVTTTENIVQGTTSHNELIRDKMPAVHNNERKRGEPEDNSNLNETVPSSDQTMSSTVNVEETNAEDTIIGLPFVKKTPAWKIYETMEVTQNPHFSPLLEKSEDFREGCALGMRLMVSYSSLLERCKGLKTDIAMSQLDSLRDSFTKLEKHGFKVTMMLSRINTLIALKTRLVTISEKLNGFDKDKMKAQEEYEETNRKIHELQRQQETLKKKKEAASKKMGQIESSARDLNKELVNVENQFEETLSTPW